MVRSSRRCVRTLSPIVAAALAFLCLSYLIKRNSPTENVFEKKNEKVVLACVHPKLDLWHQDLKAHFKKLPQLKCVDGENWVYVQNGTFRINLLAARSRNVTCDYIPILRPHGNDAKTKRGAMIHNITSGQPIDTDFFEAKCVTAEGVTYENLHSGITYKEKLHRRHTERRMPENMVALNILMFGFDSVSRMTWLRHLPKSHEYFVKELGAVMLESYNIVGDGTPQALLPILTGKTEEELPEARRGHAGATVVDGHPWIWRDLSNAGYVTQWGEDGAGIGTFQYRMLGFRDPPVDHFMRPFYLAVESSNQKKTKKPYCLRSMPRLVNMLNWVREFFDMYPDKPKFSFLFHSEYTHGDYNKLQWADEDLLAFLKHMKSSGHLENTLLILMADHGARFQAVRRTVQGKYEERLPYFGLRLPEWFDMKYSDAMRNLRTNAERLATPFDIHATFRHLFDFTTNVDNGFKKTRGISLFREHSPNRTCSDADVAPHWCACVNWQKTDTREATVKAAARALVAAINSFTQPQRDLCENLALAQISEAVIYRPPTSMLRFKSSADNDGRRADMSDNTRSTIDLYQLTIATSPGLAIYEATISRDRGAAAGKEFSVSEKEISRINVYGNQPHCVASSLPRLRPFCYCRRQMR
ncbi:hypothetical protein LSAT2_005436 [Lamellibrachia satsuma]|nr:hypothetical protein LSAT2_005436 [Lamellibrachia satsuma]